MGLWLAERWKAGDNTIIKKSNITFFSFNSLFVNLIFKKKHWGFIYLSHWILLPQLPWTRFVRFTWCLEVKLSGKEKVYWHFGHLPNFCFGEKTTRLQSGLFWLSSFDWCYTNVHFLLHSARSFNCMKHGSLCCLTAPVSLWLSKY